MPATDNFEITANMEPILFEASVAKESEEMVRAQNIFDRVKAKQTFDAELKELVRTIQASSMRVAPVIFY